MVTRLSISVALLLLLAPWSGPRGIGGHDPSCPDRRPARRPHGSAGTLLDTFEQAARIAYQADENDYWQSPAETARRKRGDCEDKALYLQHLLRLRGVETEVVFGVEDADRSARMHAWVEGRLDGELYVLDPTNGFIGRRRNMTPGRHMPVLGLPAVARKLAEYRRRTGQRGVNKQYARLIEKGLAVWSNKPAGGEASVAASRQP
jgi:hypothetical protein